VTSASSARAAAAAGTPSAGFAGGGSSNARPRYRFNPKPVYPAEARRLKQQGRVLLTVEVNAAGRPTSVTLKSSSGVPALDSAALSAVRRWSFEPARAAGLPVASRVEVPVQFALTP
jgi:protein TonB